MSDIQALIEEGKQAGIDPEETTDYGHQYRTLIFRLTAALSALSGETETDYHEGIEEGIKIGRGQVTPDRDELIWALDDTGRWATNADRADAILALFNEKGNK